MIKKNNSRQEFRVDVESIVFDKFVTEIDLNSVILRNSVVARYDHFDSSRLYKRVHGIVPVSNEPTSSIVANTTNWRLSAIGVASHLKPSEIFRVNGS